MIEVHNLNVQTTKNPKLTLKQPKFGTKHDNIESADKDMHKITKWMIGGTAITAVTIGIILLNKNFKISKNIVEIKPKKIFNIDDEELKKWSGNTVKKLEEKFKKIRDLKDWENPINNDTRQLYRGNSAGKPEENGFFYIEKFTSAEKQLIKIYDNDGYLLEIKYRGNSQNVKAFKLSNDTLLYSYCEPYACDKPMLEIQVNPDKNYYVTISHLEPGTDNQRTIDRTIIDKLCS